MKIPKYPKSIFTRCWNCGEKVELKVIKLLSNWRKKKFVVWCKKCHKLYTIYQEW